MLNEDLGASYKTFNFGVPGYSTAEHVLQTAFYEDIGGVYPSVRSTMSAGTTSETRISQNSTAATPIFNW